MSFLRKKTATLLRRAAYKVSPPVRKSRSVPEKQVDLRRTSMSANSLVATYLHAFKTQIASSPDGWLAQNRNRLDLVADRFAELTIQYRPSTAWAHECMCLQIRAEFQLEKEA